MFSLVVHEVAGRLLKVKGNETRSDTGLVILWTHVCEWCVYGVCVCVGVWCVCARVFVCVVCVCVGVCVCGVCVWRVCSVCVCVVGCVVCVCVVCCVWARELCGVCVCVRAWHSLTYNC